MEGYFTRGRDLFCILDLPQTHGVFRAEYKQVCSDRSLFPVHQGWQGDFFLDEEGIVWEKIEQNNYSRWSKREQYYTEGERIYFCIGCGSTELWHPPQCQCETL